MHQTWWETKSKACVDSGSEANNALLPCQLLLPLILIFPMNIRMKHAGFDCVWSDALSPAALVS